MAIKIWIDAGHGGSDPGAVYNGFNEKDFSDAYDIIEGSFNKKLTADTVEFFANVITGIWDEDIISHQYKITEKDFNNPIRMYDIRTRQLRVRIQHLQNDLIVVQHPFSKAVIKQEINKSVDEYVARKIQEGNQ